MASREALRVTQCKTLRHMTVDGSVFLTVLAETRHSLIYDLKSLPTDLPPPGCQPTSVLLVAVSPMPARCLEYSRCSVNAF